MIRDKKQEEVLKKHKERFPDTSVVDWTHGYNAALKEVRDAIGGCRGCKYMNDITEDIWIYCDSCRNRLGCLGIGKE